VAVGLNEAIVLQQVHYWLINPKAGVVRDGHKWIFNTYDEWKDDNFPFWSTDTIQRAFVKLEKMGLVISEKLDAHKNDMRKYYRIDYKRLELLSEPCVMEHRNLRCSDDRNLPPSITAQTHDDNKNTESPSETTQRKNGASSAAPSLAGYSIENQIYLGADQVVLPASRDFDTARARDIAGLIDMQCAGAGALALAFMEAREIIFTESQVKGQRRAARMLLEQGVKPEHVSQAVDMLAGLTCVDLYSVSKTAVGLAHPAPGADDGPVAAETY
jgi:hypothetical protein